LQQSLINSTLLTRRNRTDIARRRTACNSPNTGQNEQTQPENSCWKL